MSKLMRVVTFTPVWTVLLIIIIISKDERVICDCMEFAQLCDGSFVLFLVRVVTTFSDWTWKNVFW